MRYAQLRLLPLVEIPIYFIFFAKPVDKIPILCYHNKSIYTLQEELS